MLRILLAARLSFGGRGGEEPLAELRPGGWIPPEAGLLHGQDEPQDVSVEHAVKLILGDLFQRCELIYARIVHKYIQPSKGTTDFAFMFIPSESLYYDLLIGDVGTGSSARDLIEYGFREKKVIIVSPTSFMAYLQTVM